MRVYVASPLGFTPAGKAWSDTVLLPALRAAGHEPVDPWRDSPAGRALAAARTVAELSAANAAVGAANAEDIRGCTGLLAVLDGPDVDSGTAAEIGFGFALGLRTVGLRTDLRVTGDNAATVVNLQVEHFLGGRVARDLAAAVALLTG